MSGLKYFFIAVFTALILSVIKGSAAKKEPIKVSEGGGPIAPGKGTAWFTIIGGAMMFSAGVFGLFAGEYGASALIMLLGAAIAGFMLPSLFNIHDLIWDENGVTGASSLFGPTLGQKRDFIAWEKIENSGITVTQYWFIRSSDGRKIYWSYLYNGFPLFHEALKKNCDLTIA